MEIPRLDLQRIHYDVQSIKDRLIRYQEKEKDIEHQRERYERIRGQLSSFGVSTLSDMPHGPSSTMDKVAETIAKAMDIESDLNRVISEQREERESLEAILRNLKSACEKAVIRIRYFDGMPWHEVAVLIFGSEPDFEEREESYVRRITRIHGSALLSMAIVIYKEQHGQEVNVPDIKN